MIKRYLPLIALAVIISSCNSGSKKVPATDIEVTNAFVRNILDNNFEEAAQYLLKDSANVEMFETFRKQYNRQDKAILEQYKKSQITVHEASTLIPDSVFIFKYSNSYRPSDTTVLKALRTNGKWLIDLKYTFAPNP
jgi:tRNA G37 N-methylase Trm5